MRAESNSDVTKQPQTTDSNKQYLEIPEWDVKLPLTEMTRGARYKLDGSSAALLVDIEGDLTGDCEGQAFISRAVDPSPELEDWREQMRVPEEGGHKVGDAYYFITGSQAQCSEDDSVQERASNVRADFLNQRTAIEAR